MTQLPSRRPAWIGLAGPTASGKTSLALELARQFPLEIISVDSALVYRGMDVGTAKPSTEEQAQVRHHLLDLIEPSQSYSAARFVADARAALADIRARGKLPLLVGGTMLYFKALIDGMDEMPASDPEVRARLDALAEQIGWPAMHARLALVDPVTAQRLAPQDSQRIQRALEVFEISGQALSAFHQQKAALGRTHSQADQGSEIQQAGPALLFSLEPQDRAWLHRRIAQRFEQMLDAGLIEEVRQLRERGDLQPDLPSMRCVGYRQVWGALDERLEGRALRARLLETGVAATRQLAKRQITWLRSMKRHAMAAEQPETSELRRALAQECDAGRST